MSAIAFDRVILPLLTLVMSGVVASAVTFKLNARLQRRDLMRGKLEETYTSLHEYANLLGTHFLTWFSAFRGELEIDQVNQLTIDQSNRAEPGHYRRLELLVAIYFPNLEDVFGELVACREKMGGLVGEFRNQYRAGDSDGRRFITPLRNAMTELSSVEERFKIALRQEAKKWA